ncbi:hypothetical protein [Parapedobacter sp.]
MEKASFQQKTARKARPPCSFTSTLNAGNVVGTEIKDLVASALKKVANIDRRYENGDIEEKRLIVSSMFPDFLEFDGTQHRTPRLNSAVALICQNNSKLHGKKKDKR